MWDCDKRPSVNVEKVVNKDLLLSAVAVAICTAQNLLGNRYKDTKKKILESRSEDALVLLVKLVKLDC